MRHVFLLVSLGLVACSLDVARPSMPAGPDGPEASSPPSSVDAAADAGGTCTPGVARFDAAWSTGTSGPTTFYAHVPSSPKGLVIALHGTNGSAESVATKRVEWGSFHAAAIARGYAVLVPESEEREKPRQWDNSLTPDNPDVARIASLIDGIRSRGDLPATAPIYVIGMSQGGGVAPIFGQLLARGGYPVRAVSAFCAGGSAVYAHAQYTLPTIFAAGEADEVLRDAVGDVERSTRVLRSRGVDAEWCVKPVEKLCPERFTRIPGIDADASRRIHEGLVAAGEVSADGTVLTSGDDRAEASTLSGVPADLAAFTGAVDEQLQVVAAQHVFFGDRNDATLAFFEAHP